MLEDLYNEILLGNKEQTIVTDNNTEEPLNIMLSERDFIQRKHSMWIYLYEILERQPESIGEIIRTPWSDRVEAGGNHAGIWGNFLGDVNVLYILIGVEVTQIYAFVNSINIL